MPMPRRRPELATGVEDQVPYDQAGVMGQDMPQSSPAVPPPSDGGQPMDLGAMGAPPEQAPMDLGGLGDQGGAPPPQMGMGGDMAPEDIQAEQLAAALEDPNLPPAQKQQIEQELQLAARRQLAGLGG